MISIKGRQATSATIKLYLKHGDAKGLRTAEISNWTGKAIAAPRTELEELLLREELGSAGVYVLLGRDLETNNPLGYIGEAEIVGDRLRQHRSKEFWVPAMVFVSTDQNLTKAHARYLERRLIEEAQKVNRFKLQQNQSGGSGLPESDREEVEVFLTHIKQLLPVLESDILTPIAELTRRTQQEGMLFNRMKGAEAKGQRTANGFVVFESSTAVLEDRPSAGALPRMLWLSGKNCERTARCLSGTDFWCLPAIRNSQVHRQPRLPFMVAARMAF